ncbi:MAG: hypothetical protein ABIP17_07055, partial [Ilumatobacteraceae bacterium]
VAEEDATDLLGDGSGLLDGVTSLVGTAIGRDASRSEVVDWISLGSADATGSRFWTLDPIDGAKGSCAATSMRLRSR